MPAGYTAAIYHGDITFREFALTCAGAFGARIDMRDEPLSAPIRADVAVSPSYRTRLTAAEANLARIEAWTDEDADAAADEERARKFAAAEEDREECRAREERYRAMAAQVRAWEPPTADHQRLRELMLEQLREGARRDCVPLPRSAVPGGAKYRRMKVASARLEVQRAAEQYAEEWKRANERTAWVRALLESLPPAEPAVAVLNGGTDG